MLVQRGLGVWAAIGVAIGIGCGSSGGGNAANGGVGDTGAGANPYGVTGVTGVAAPQPTPATGASPGAAPAPTGPAAGTAGTAAPAPGTGAAGSGASAMMAAATTDPTAMGPTAAPPTPGTLAMGECGLHTKYPGDEYCILPPPPDKGFQLHIGPSNYDNPEPQYLLQPSQEITSDFSAVSGNTQMVYFYYRQYRQRPGAHHNIITAGSGVASGLGSRIGTSNNLAADDPPGGVIAPENMDVGVPLTASTPINVSLHSINTSTQVELREVWVNFWYVDPSQVKEPVKEIFDIAPQPAIQPGQDITYGSSCTVSGTGRLLWMYGHRHANNVRFSTWRIRGTQQDLIYQAYNWEDPLVLDYSTTVQNAVPDTGPNVEGGWSGILDLKPGDQLKWECHVINQTTSVLNFTNNTYTGEMCIVDAETVGATCP
jgi:hypothetical protein